MVAVRGLLLRNELPAEALIDSAFHAQTFFLSFLFILWHGVLVLMWCSVSDPRKKKTLSFKIDYMVKSKRMQKGITSLYMQKLYFPVAVPPRVIQGEKLENNAAAVQNAVMHFLFRKNVRVGFLEIR